MTARRFIGAVALQGPLRSATARTVAQAARAIGAEPVPMTASAVLAAPGARFETAAAAGGSLALLGDVFRKDSSGRVRRLPPDDADRAVSGRGAHLLRHFWGDYLAFIGDTARFDIVRAPFGERPLCWFQGDGALIFASDLKLLANCGCDLRATAWEEITRHLAEPDVRRDRTCLTEVSELRGGHRLTIAGGQATNTTLWTPWTGNTDSASTPAELRAVIDRCVADKLSAFAHPLLLLSGGLDSSILAAALARSGKRFSALNLVTRDSAGDERAYARIAASAFNIPYFEAVRELTNVDPFVSAAKWLPRPALRSFLQDSAILTEAVAARENCDVLIEGSGGDNIFCSLQSVAPVADRIRCGGTLGAVLGSARDIAQLTDATVATVLRRAVHRAWLRTDTYRVRPDHTFLSKDAVALSEGATQHPWLNSGRKVLPGQAGHAAMLVAAQGWAECLDPLSPLPTLGPLLAQPIVEACFAVPSWSWFKDGQNRVVAREAYRGTLPDALLDRRSKATPDCFVTRLFERHRVQLAEFLLDGHLARAGLLHRAVLETALRHEGPLRDHAHYRIMRIADVEAWLEDRPAASF